ncbi:LacI family DNA-binding transcriptional regulator [Cellulosilyticum ruminicola]|uniref:LacI family DNA-binding transcriptional regulator n=1 Tax=Cellulosilyticum ruminicola TaxID=425254 RepID=UPI0006D0FB93|nr:LacI family DNA-binding transcriptional regulator [Cellulosilyticum ruminicola]
MSLKEIAKIAGVSPATVSRVLNNPDYHCTDPKARERIWKAVKELDYVPNEAARNLKKGDKKEQRKTHYIQILMTRTDSGQTDVFFDELLHIIESEIHKNFCILTHVWYDSLFSSDRKCKQENVELVVRKLFEEVEDKTSGLIIVGKLSYLAIPAIKKYFHNIVSVSRNSSALELDEVTCDGRKIAIQAIEHLISLGHQDIGYVGECNKESRYQGYLETLEKNNIDQVAEYICNVKPTEANGFQVVEQIMQLEYPPSAIYCANDILAVGMLKALSKTRKRFFDLSIISSDNIELAERTSPSLTTIALPKEEMGRFAVMFLLDRIEGKHKLEMHLELKSRLIIRESCKRFGNNEWSDYVI